MEKYIYIIFATLAFAFVGCVETDEEPGGTSVEKMAGYWTVTVDAVDGSGNIVVEDPFRMGYSHVSTYNTAADVSTEMFVDDGGNFWEYKLKVDVNYAARTFTSNGQKDNMAYESKVEIKDGKVLESAATTPSGMPADSIVFFVSFDDDDTGYTQYKVSGFRYTGFPADN